MLLVQGPHFENQGLGAGTPTPGRGRGGREGGVGGEHWISRYRLEAQSWVTPGSWGQKQEVRLGVGLPRL